MSYKEFLILMDEDYRCCLAIEGAYKSFCGHTNAMDMVTGNDICKANLSERPDWCPLKEVEGLKKT